MALDLFRLQKRNTEVNRWHMAGCLNCAQSAFFLIVHFPFEFLFVLELIQYIQVYWILWLVGIRIQQTFATWACRKRRLIMGYKLAYTTGLLYAWSSCMQWGVWVWTVRHWVVPDQVIYCSKGGWVLFLKRTNSIPERRSWVTAPVVSRSSRNSLISLKYVT